LRFLDRILGCLPPKLEDIIDIAGSNAQKQLSLINSILSLSQLEQGAVPLVLRVSKERAGRLLLPGPQLLPLLREAAPVGECLREELLAPVAHRHVVFTIPRLLGLSRPLTPPGHLGSRPGQPPPAADHTPIGKRLRPISA
jgi:signal transduction histidine kinase